MINVTYISASRRLREAECSTIADGSGFKQAGSLGGGGMGGGVAGKRGV